MAVKIDKDKGELKKFICLMGKHQKGSSREEGKKKTRTWMGTIWQEADKEQLKQLNYKYLIISDDDHTKDGQLHWHCLITFQNPRGYPLKTDIHWEKPHDHIGAIRYCMDKGPNFFEDGEITIDTNNQKDWRGFIEVCKQQTPREMIDGPYSKLYAQYRSFAGEVHATFKKLNTIDGDLENLWLWGCPGTGKTKYVFENYQSFYIKQLNKWWDGYSDEEIVLIDDWHPKYEMLASLLKIWADRYPFRAEIKGSSTIIRPKKIIITSNYKISQCFPNNEDVMALKRRFKTMHFLKLGDPPEEK